MSYSKSVRSTMHILEKKRIVGCRLYEVVWIKNNTNMIAIGGNMKNYPKKMDTLLNMIDNINVEGDFSQKVITWYQI